MRYRVSHRTTYRYSYSVDLAQHLAHLRPRTLPGQTVTQCEVVVEPAADDRATHVDHFGNTVDGFRIDEPHEELVVEMRAEVDVSLPVPPPAESTPSWESMRDAFALPFPVEIEASEYVHASPLVTPDDAALAYARASFPTGATILQGARDLTRRIRADFTYTPGATDISTPLAEVFARRVGVCQDFAHVQIAALRSLGLPAAYVSGYIRTYHDPGQAELRGADASHAWVAVWCGAEAGWVHLDPTNDLVAHDEHVIVAWGRDFADVSPVRGIILGGGRHTYGVEVELVPLA
jgi:transglutaminase-like putative cysteine protease